MSTMMVKDSRSEKSRDRKGSGTGEGTSAKDDLLVVIVETTDTTVKMEKQEQEDALKSKSGKVNDGRRFIAMANDKTKPDNNSDENKQNSDNETSVMRGKKRLPRNTMAPRLDAFPASFGASIQDMEPAKIALKEKTI